MKSKRIANIVKEKQVIAETAHAGLTLAVALVTLLVSPVGAAFAEEPGYKPSVGDKYTVRSSYESSSDSSTGSNGRSSGHNTIVERVIGVREGGLEIEYGLPDELPELQKAKTWQLPVRVFRPTRGPMQILNTSELEARVEVWLQTHGMTREACGRWTFSWSAHFIECDPRSVVDMLNSFDLRVQDISDGALYDDDMAKAPGSLEKTATAEYRETYNATLEIDPDAVQQERAKSDVATGEILNEPVTLEAALEARGENEVTGTIRVTLEADLAGNVWRLSKVTETKTKLASGGHESDKLTEIIERQRVQ